MIRNKYHSINVLAPSHLCVSVKSEDHKITEKAQCLVDQVVPQAILCCYESVL
jgi:hypothetical protein